MSTEKASRPSALRAGVGVFLRSLVAVVLCFIVYFSLSLLFNGIFTKTDGYRIVEVDEEGNEVAELCVIKYDDPQTLIDAKEKGIDPDKLTESQHKRYTKTEMSQGARTAMYIVTSIFMLLLYAAFTYDYLWHIGDRDCNAVQFGHAREDRLYGLKVGLISRVPMFLFWLAVVISKVTGTIQTIILPYRICNMPFLPLMNAIAGGTPQFTSQLPWAAILLYGLTLFYIPVVCVLAYALGYSRFSVKEHLIYTGVSDEKKKLKAHTDTMSK